MMTFKEINKDLRIVFMGTPEFAVTSLDKIITSGYNVVGVVTSPDKPAGRGLQVNESAIKKYATSKNLKILQPEKLKNESFLQALQALHADLQIVVAFRMLPEVVWSMPKLGTINLHASLLPQYRGAAPINWAIINGETETGLTTFKLQQEIDTGNILLSEKIIIREDETAGELHDEMKEKGAGLLLNTIEGLSKNVLKEVVQKEFLNNNSGISKWKHAPKILSETGKINWDKSLEEVYNLIRGLSPYPAAYTTLQSKVLKIFKGTKEFASTNNDPGAFVTDKKTFLKFACKNGYISVLEIQLEGKKKMDVAEFLRGYRF